VCFLFSKLDLQLQKSAADEDYKVRVDELTFENRQMKSQVTDANTNLAVLRSEIVTLRQEYEAKCDELERYTQLIFSEVLVKHKNTDTKETLRVWKILK